jgi:hypothetical protein
MPTTRQGSEPGEISILSVSYQTEHFLVLQQEIMRRLCSDGRTLNWHVIDTSPDPQGEELLRSTPGITLHESDIRERYRPDRCPANVSPRSWQHAMALNRLIRETQGRYALVIDPDCFVLAPSWDLKLIGAMPQDGKALIGASYHPARRYKYGFGFPTPTLLFVCLPELVALGADFAPGDYPDFSSFPFRIPALRFLKYGTWCDTGSRIVARARAAKWPSICFSAPLLRPRLEARGVWRAVRQVVPQRFLLLPKRPYRRPDGGLIPETELVSAPGGDLYEEYYYENELFACHLRGISQRAVHHASDEAQFWVRRILAHVERRDWAPAGVSR